MFNKNTDPETAAIGCLLWATLGIFILPFMCLFTLLRDGPENTPGWMIGVLIAVAAGIGYLIFTSIYH